MSSTGSSTPGAPAEHGRLGLEVVLVLGLSLGASAVYSIISFIDSATQSTPIGSQTTTLNPSQSPRPLLDIAYNLYDIAAPLVAVLLALFFLAPTIRAALRRIGLDGKRPKFDLLLGLGLAAVVGIPGLGLYVAARALGLNLSVLTDGIGPAWYAIPILILSALRAALQEEVIMIGYLFDRLERLGWRAWVTIATSALVRGSYHLYQGVGGFVGNALMGVLFGVLYRRFGRVAPLVVTHFILDFVSFVGYAVLKQLAPTLLPH